MTFKKQQQVGVRGRSSRSIRLGIKDPRHRRGAQAQTRGEDYAPPLEVDKYGRLSINVKELKKLLDAL